MQIQNLNKVASDLFSCRLGHNTGVTEVELWCKRPEQALFQQQKQQEHWKVSWDWNQRVPYVCPSITEKGTE